MHDYPFKIIDRVAECADEHNRGWRIGSDESERQIVVHRTIWDGDAVEVCKRFQSYEPVNGRSGLAQYTGKENPYHFIIQPNANAVQCIALNERGAHARRWNSSGIAIALMHDTIHSPLPHAMGVTLIRLCRILCLYVGGAEKLFGHDELPGARKDPTKVCPGISMHEVRKLVRETTDGWYTRNSDQTQLAAQLIHHAGIRLEQVTYGV